MAYNKQYKDFLEISPNFESVVDIDADKRNQNLWREYIVGDDMENLVDVLCQSLGNEAPDARRSFWVHGSYGTGKSYAAIFVKHLLEEKPRGLRRVPVEVLSAVQISQSLYEVPQQGRLSGDLEDRLHGHPHRRHDAGGS